MSSVLFGISELVDSFLSQSHSFGHSGLEQSQCDLLNSVVASNELILTVVSCCASLVELTTSQLQLDGQLGLPQSHADGATGFSTFVV